MSDLSFEIVSAAPARDLVTPTIGFDLRIANKPPEERIQALLLRSQIQIEVARRRYSGVEQDRLRPLFDEPSRWGETLRTMTWTNLSSNVTAFTGETIHTLLLPCSFDFNVATAKYFQGIEGGEVPLTFLFSGTVFFENDEGALQVAPISWNSQARFRLPIETWKTLMDMHQGDEVCLNLRRDVFDDLCRLRGSFGLTTFEETIQRMISLAERKRPVI